MENSECTLPACDSHSYPLTHTRCAEMEGDHSLGTLGENFHTALWPVSLRVSKSRHRAKKKLNILR